MNRDLASEGWTEIDRGGFAGYVGPLWTRSTPEGHRQLAVIMDERHANQRGVMHGGMMMTLLDQALGMHLTAQGPMMNATIQLDTHFLAPARIGDCVEVTAEIVRETRSMAFMAARAMVGDRLIATARGVWARRDPLEAQQGEGQR